MRRISSTKVTGPNPLWRVYRTVSFLKVSRNTVLIEAGRFCPSMRIKRRLYQYIGMTIGPYTSIAYRVTPDIMFPEKITIGTNCIIGFNTTLLCHEYLVHEYRTGDIIIGDEVMIGANVTVLPGVNIGHRAVIGAGSVVSKDVPAGAFAYGCPLQIRSEVKS
ncbi:acyltransferase [Macrococcus equipercicus]|uniref:Acyltransferase n=1 Tax=Macrococcus equipercicus TaxID=69967 RepID=A0A9Q9F221_9STAP|nr:acyltransferase [Macrococcus equipercicus]UTH14350.1 acyltransferase [Macrococcus equipercicus]